MGNIPQNLNDHYLWWSAQRSDIPYGHCWCGCGQRTHLAKATKRKYGQIRGAPSRYIHGHHLLWKPFGSPDYKAEERGHDTPCWTWLKSRDHAGYGLGYDGTRLRRAHIIYYEDAYGPVPDGMELDHLCRNRDCVHTTHLEPVTHTQNIRRGKKAKLTLSVARQIRNLASEGMNQTQLAMRFGVSRHTVADVLHNRTWKD